MFKNDVTQLANQKAGLLVVNTVGNDDSCRTGSDTSFNQAIKINTELNLNEKRVEVDVRQLRHVLLYNSHLTSSPEKGPKISCLDSARFIYHAPLTR